MTKTLLDFLINDIELNFIENGDEGWLDYILNNPTELEKRLNYLANEFEELHGEKAIITDEIKAFYTAAINVYKNNK